MMKWLSRFLLAALLTTVGIAVADITGGRGPATGFSGGSTVVDVKALLGAAGDGVTDDYTKIAAAIAQLPSNGGTVYFPHSTGCYMIGTGLALPNNVRILGDGDEYCDH